MYYVVEIDASDCNLGRIWECESLEECAEQVAHTIIANRSGGPMPSAEVDKAKENIMEDNYHNDDKFDLSYQIGIKEN